MPKAREGDWYDGWCDGWCGGAAEVVRLVFLHPGAWGRLLRRSAEGFARIGQTILSSRRRGYRGEGGSPRPKTPPPGQGSKRGAGGVSIIGEFGPEIVVSNSSGRKPLGPIEVTTIDDPGPAYLWPDGTVTDEPERT
ncbi:MAG: hypothetical protein ACLFWG_00045 [Longimicrobiales bacterium]